MATTVEEALAQQQAVQEAVGMLPQQQQPKQPGANEDLNNYIEGMIGEQMRQNAPVIRRNMFAQPSPSVQTSGTQTKPSPTDNGNVVRQTRPVISSTDELARAMGYTSPEEEERLRKASVANQRIMAVADAVRHIGNIASAINYAPAMKFNNPVAEEQARYQKGKALRDAANYKYLSYQQQKAAQEAKQRQWEADYQLKMEDAARKAGYTEAQIKNMQDRLEQQKAYQEGQLELGKRRADDAKALGEARLKESSRHNRASEGLGYARLKETKRHNGVIESYRTPTKTSNGRGNGYTYSTRRGSVTIPSDYLSKNKINKRSLLTAMERAGAIDSEWLDNYDRAIWNEKQQEQMLDDAVSNWLMTDDAAEDYMVKHLKGQSSWTESNSKSNPYDDNSGKRSSGNHKSNPYG